MILGKATTCGSCTILFTYEDDEVVDTGAPWVTCPRCRGTCYLRGVLMPLQQAGLFTYEIWSWNNMHALTPASKRNSIFGEGKMPYSATRVVTMKLPNDDSAVLMYKSYFDALGTALGDQLRSDCQLPIVSTVAQDNQ